MFKNKRKLNWEKELETQKLITSFENSNNHEGYRTTPFQVPTYACYLNCAEYCSAGQNSIDRYLDATGFDAEVLEEDTDVGNVCLYDRALTIHSKKDGDTSYPDTKLRRVSFCSSQGF